LSQAKSKSAERYNNLLLVAALALFILCCIGQVAVEQKYHYKLQANTVRTKTVLSNIVLAMQIINDKRYKINEKDLRIVFESIDKFTQKISDII